MNQYPCVSVLLPTYNSEKTIHRAIYSIFAQTLQPAEIIVVDDGSSDNTISCIKTICASFNSDILKLIKLTSNHGVSYARNIGWDVATGQFLAFLDSDDAWHPQKLQIQVDFMRQHPDVVLSSHRFHCPQDTQTDIILPKELNSTTVSARSLLWFYQFSTPSVMLRRNIPFRFHPCKRRSGDRLLWLQIALNGHKVVRLELPLVYLYKAPYGEGGLSGHLWEAEKSELDNYSQLREAGLLNRSEEIPLKVFAFLKYLRRVGLLWKRSHVT